ncbi:sigma 54-interacting transcriptional regulator [Brevibacillus centrosporus]|uniref:sigma 54-interacting transcriptional regulator n=1 Tax=Brevibacillus centrosporus TaxID=54910 RepID=UPI002E1ADE18|nr:sigma 54-interacting transcriptional regulator [Brevibacillus centrosporus]MED4907371.1 sigma 54-interacting transcriptional regulator [Brevibacillus centrosporus]
MKRLDLIYQKFLDFGLGKKISASELAEMLGLSRANVSSDLNKLWKAGKIEKADGRPTLFYAKQTNETLYNTETALDRLAKGNKSLLTPIEQAKAAVLYPPRGMHCLILGETGVGKSGFAGLIHEFSIDIGRLDKDAPFVVFNCADYANNPQLLYSQLFGVKKGAYTGAENDRRGLVEKADGGILFLDEVHRLPAEGQEIFFTFMDKGTFRRVGETEVERTAQVQIISATTENPESSLLKTFIRRIPMVIKLPSLDERGMEERFGILINIFREEAFRLGREIQISASAIHAFLSYHCPNNIGQLKTDIQLTCASAYADFISLKKKQLQVSVQDLPHHVKQGLLLAKERKAALEELVGKEHKSFVVQPTQDSISIERETEDTANSVYEKIEQKIQELRNQGVSEEELEFDIENYFTLFIKGVNKRINKEDMSRIIDPIIVNLVEEIVRYAETRLGKILSQKVIFGLALHIQTSKERLAHGKQITNPHINSVRIKYKKEFAVALECVRMIEEAILMDLPIDEAGYLTMFFVLDDESLQKERETVGVLVITHGSGGATAMVDVTNRLLVTDYAKAIDLPLEEEYMKVLEQAIKLAREVGSAAGLLLLVDMGSLLGFGEIIEKEVGIPVKVIPMVSTPHVIEATRKAMLGHTLEDVYRDVSSLSSLTVLQNEEQPKQEPAQELAPALAIVAACLSGEGSALFLKRMLENRLRYDSQLVEIIPLQLIDKAQARNQLKQIKNERKVLCIVSNYMLDKDLRCYGMDDVLNGEALQDIQQMIDLEEAFMKMVETLGEHLTMVDSRRVLGDVRACMGRMEERLHNVLVFDTRIGAYLHVCCLIDRLKAGLPTVDYAEKESFLAENRRLYSIVRHELQLIEDQYEISIREDDVCFIMNFFLHNKTLV